MRRRGELAPGVHQVPESIDHEVGRAQARGARGRDRRADRRAAALQASRGGSGRRAQAEDPDLVRASRGTLEDRVIEAAEAARRAASTRPPALRGGIDLGGTKIEAIVVDSRQHACSAAPGTRRRPTGGPADVASADGGGDDRGGQAAGTRAAAARPASASARPGSVDAATGTVVERAQPARLGRQLRARRRRSQSAARNARSWSETTSQVATDAEFELGAGKPYKSLLGVFWGTGIGGGLILDGKPWLGRGGAGEIGHMVVEPAGANAPAAAAAAWRRTPAARRWRPARAS